MQWILENQGLIVSALSGAVISGLGVGWWVKQKMQFSHQLMEQQLTSNQQLANSQINQLQQELQQAQQELDELDSERDKAAYESKQLHGKMMAVMEKLRYFEAVKQERQQYADDLNRAREQKSQLEAQLREQEAHHEQQTKANQEKLELLEKAEERLKQQFEHLRTNCLKAKPPKSTNKTARV